MIRRPNLFALLTLIIISLTTSQTLLAKKTKRRKNKMSAKVILKKVEQRTSPPYESVQMDMKTTESDKSSKERSLTIKRVNNKKEQKALVRLLAPSNLKGLALLTINANNDENQWLYLPSSKRTRRIIGSNKKSRFLDSELNYEDLRISTYKAFDNKIIKKNKKIAVIESKAKKEDDSSYGKIKTWVSLKHFRVEKVEYYDKKKKHLKTMTFAGYKKYGKKFWRAKKMLVKNVQKSRSTELKLKKISLKKIDEGLFTISALESI